ncbi:uncharacterized protein E5676_scaffold852G00020 [Cucumis melo var. makuwa]|uniref:Envelope-like protein n=1 Tax=Cucumis melo var. makuwa TaxID=1194695 RepID=A0A5A7T103_CUCMM|nr:uncharacterized protein E6C27_scaffold228G00570 [Cucumis melo var. makuwa]TYK07570.1 uncharacterized protein E5676_scaffold852G00020 [Cucumis melo var. makuwa]
MHGVRMRGNHFKSTPPQRPYRLPSEKSQIHVSESFHVPVHEDVVAKSAAKSVENAPSVSKTHILDMDSESLDDIPLARLLKKSSVSDVTPAKPTDPIISVHSKKRSSSEDVFVPTPANVTTSNPHFEPAPVSGDESITTEGRTGVSADEAPDHDKGVKLANTSTTNTDVHNDSQPETQQFPEVPRPTRNKFQSNQRNISTKTRRKKIPPNIPSIPIDGISFHLEENIQRWKYVVQQRIADEICHDDTIDTGSFIYNQLLRHVGSFGVKISIALPRFFSGLLLHLNVVVLTMFDSPGPEPKTLSLSYRLFQDNHVPDIENDMCPSRAPRMFTSINLLSEQRLEVDSLIRHLKSLAPSTSMGEHGPE